MYKEKPNKKAKTKATEEPRNNNSKNKKTMLHSYVEDIAEDRAYEPWNDSIGHTEDERSPIEGLPEAPTPPPAAQDEHVNVFDFLVATGQTPNASNMNLAGQEGGESTSLVRYEYDAKEYLDPSRFMDGDEPLVQYGTGPVPAGGSEFVTPAAKERRRSRDSEVKKDKKRKRLHVDVAADQIMTDAPPVLHSGLTGGLKTLMRPALPPSPDYSGGDCADQSPASPLKKSKSKHSKGAQVSNSIFDMITGGPKTKSSKHKSKKHSSRRDKEQKLLEYQPDSKDGKHASHDGQMVLFKPRADAFLSVINKGPTSEKGYSMNKALKRFHRERQAAGSNAPRSKEEKELWRALRLRRNDRGEIVLFVA